MSTPAPSQSSSWLRRFARRWTRRLLVLLVLAVIAYPSRAALLRWSAEVLIHEDAPATCSHVVILGGDRRYDHAARAVKGGQAKKVLLNEWAPSRVEQLGIVPPGEAISRRELTKRGVHNSQIELIPGNARSPWDRARQLKEWMDAHPEATILTFAQQLLSARDRIILRRTLTAEQMSRVRIIALPHREYNETNWWKVKGGGLAFGYGMLDLTYTWIGGEGEPFSEPPTMDELEATVP